MHGANGQLSPAQVLPRSEFRLQDSLLDDLYENSWLRKSSLSGMYHLLITFQYLYFVSSFFLQAIHGKLLNDMSTLISISNHLYIIVCVSSLLLLLPTCAYLLHLILWKYNPPASIVKALYQLCEVSMFGFLIYLRMNKQWPMANFLFIGAFGMIIYMKGHSYFHSILEYRKASLHKVEGKSTYVNKSVTYEEALELHRYLYFLVAPVLVYEPIYPRTEKIYPGYLVMKALQTVFYLIVLYETYVLLMKPVLNNLGKVPVGSSFIQILLSISLAAINGFLCIFEGLLNCIAEIICFGDRRFYHDFWNSTTFDEFSRRWNRPVHDFLKRHVYVFCLKSLKCSNFKAYVLTLLYSAFFHELVLYMFFGVIHPTLSMEMLAQAPMIFLSAIFRRNNLGNTVYWTAMVIGVSASFFPYIMQLHDQSTSNPYI